MSVWTYVKAEPFFRDFLPAISSHRHKIRGKNGRGKPFDGFSPAEKKAINKALVKMVEDLKL
jgi:hypothetical protein